MYSGDVDRDTDAAFRCVGLGFAVFLSLDENIIFCLEHSVVADGGIGRVEALGRRLRCTEAAKRYGLALPDDAFDIARVVGLDVDIRCGIELGVAANFSPDLLAFGGRFADLRSGCGALYVDAVYFVAGSGGSLDVRIALGINRQRFVAVRAVGADGAALDARIHVIIAVSLGSILADGDETDADALFRQRIRSAVLVCQHVHSIGMQFAAAIHIGFIFRLRGGLGKVRFRLDAAHRALRAVNRGLGLGLHGRIHLQRAADGDDARGSVRRKRTIVCQEGPLGCIEVSRHLVDRHRQAGQIHRRADRFGDYRMDGVLAERNFNVSSHMQIAGTGIVHVRFGHSVCAGLANVDRSIGNVCSETAVLAALRIGVHQIVVVHIYAAHVHLAVGIVNVCARLEAAVSLRFGMQHGNVVELNVAFRLIDTCLGESLGIGNRLKRAINIHIAAARHGGDLSRDCRVRGAYIHTGDRQLDIFTGSAADSRVHGIVVGIGVSVEVGFSLYGVGFNNSAIDGSALAAAYIGLDHIDRDLHNIRGQGLVFNAGVCLRGCVGNCADAAVCLQGRAAEHAGFGHGAYTRVGDIGLNAAKGRAHAAARLCGNRVCLCGVGIGHGDAAAVGFQTAALGEGTEAAISAGDQHVHAKTNRIRIQVTAVHLRAGDGISGIGYGNRAAHQQIGIAGVGMAGGIRIRHAHIGLRADQTCVNIAADAVAQQHGCAGSAVVIEAGAYRNAGALDGDILDVGLLRSLLVGNHYSCGNLDLACIKVGLLHIRDCGCDARCRYLHSAAGIHAAAAGDICIGIGLHGSHRDIGGDVQVVRVYAAQRRSDIRVGLGGMIGAYIDVGNVCSFLHIHIGMEGALRVSHAYHGSRADRAEVLILDQALHTSLASAADIHSTAGQSEIVCADPRDGAGSAIGHGHIDRHADDGSAARLQGGLGSIQIVSVSIVQFRNRAYGFCGDIAAGNLSLLRAAQHRNREGRSNIYGSESKTDDPGFRGSFAIRANEQSVMGRETAGTCDLRHILRFVIGDGGVDAYGNAAHVARNGEADSFSGIAIAGGTGIDPDGLGGNARAIEIDLSVVARAQVYIGHGSAYGNAAVVERAQIRLGDGVHVRIYADRAVRTGIHIRAVDRCISVGAVECHQDISAHSHTACREGQDAGLSVAADIVRYCHVGRVDAALGGSRCAICGGESAGSRADVGKHRGRNDCHCAGNAYGNGSDLRADDVGMRIGIEHIALHIQTADIFHGDALSHEGIHAGQVDCQRNRTVYGHSAAGDRACAGYSIGLKLGQNIYIAHIADARVALDRGSNIRLGSDLGNGSAHANHTACNRNRYSQRVGEFVQSLDCQAGRAGNIARQISLCSREYIHRGNCYGYAHESAARRHGDGADGALAQVNAFAAAEMLLNQHAVLFIGRHILFNGAGAGNDFNISARIQHSVIRNMCVHIGEHDCHCDACANACVCACGDGRGDDIGLNIVIGDHMDVGIRIYLSIAADESGGGILRRLLCVAGHFAAKLTSCRDIGIGFGIDFCVFAGILIVGFRIVAERIAVDTIEIIAAVSGFAVEAVLGFSVGIYLGGAHGRFALADAVAFEIRSKAVLAVCLYPIAGESIIKELVGVETSLGRSVVCCLLFLGEVFIFLFGQNLVRTIVAVHDQTVCSILGQLAAGDEHHDGGAHAGRAAAADVRSVHLSIALVIRMDVNRAGSGTDEGLMGCIAADDGCAGGIIHDRNDGGNTHSRNAAGCHNARNTNKIKIIIGGYVDTAAFKACIFACLGLGVLLGDDDIHCAADARSAAACSTGNISRNEFFGIRRYTQLAAGFEYRVFKHERFIGSFIIGNNCYRGHSSSAGTCHCCSNIDQIAAASGMYADVTVSDHAAA